MNKLIGVGIILSIIYLFASIVHGSFNIMAWENVDRLFFALGCSISLILYSSKDGPNG